MSKKVESKSNNKEKEEKKLKKDEVKKETTDKVSSEIQEKDLKIARLEKEIVDLKNDKLLLLAELDNKLKDFQQQIEYVYKYSNRKLIVWILDFLVDLEERALKAMQDNPKSKASEHLEGIEMIKNNLKKNLESEGVKEIEIKIGETPWSSRDHELIEEVENDELPERKVVEVVEKGYFLHNQVLRPAKVKITKKPNNN